MYIQHLTAVTSAPQSICQIMLRHSYSLMPSLTRSHGLSLKHSPTHPLTHSLIHTVVHSLTSSRHPQLTPSFTCSISGFLACSLTHSLTHSHSPPLTQAEHGHPKPRVSEDGDGLLDDLGHLETQAAAMGGWGRGKGPGRYGEVRQSPH